jgi:hypothetical protein
MVNQDRVGSYLSFVRKDTPAPIKRRRYDAAFQTEALHLAAESRSTQAVARALYIDLPGQFPERVLTVGPEIRYGLF